MTGGPERVDRRPNRLEGQTSPYLLQHLYNPVDWYPWGEDALQTARRDGKPIFLSIGYSACHWCHVMERESFENDGIARFLNEHFVPIKVDREERPDLDDIYMSAAQMLSGQGGWPLSVFLTPDQEPFYAGTYFPPEDRWGRPGFLTLLLRVHEVWSTRREDIARSAGEIAERLRAMADPSVVRDDAIPGQNELASAAAELARRFDGRFGGFGGAPKFPPEGQVALLLREHARSGDPASLRMAEVTLDRMALGGMYDQVGGGFARYSTDERWLVPHFEKMLYNQALLVPVYADAWLVTRKPLYRRVVEETLDFVRRELTDSGGGFLSSLDADSEGHEGKFYVFTPDEVCAVLGPQDGDLVCEIYGIESVGNFEGKSIPNLLGGSLAERASREGQDEEVMARRVAPLLAKLREARGRRVRPATDDKVLTAWNGLMIGAFARAYQVFGRSEDLESARRSASFVLANLFPESRLLASWRAGKSQWNAYLDDHAFLARGLLDLYEASFDRSDLEASTRVARAMVARFEDRKAGGFFFTSDDHELLLSRNRSLHDGALPAGSGVAAEVLLRLAVHRQDASFRDSATRTLQVCRPLVARAPSAFASHLAAADFAQGPVAEVVVVGPKEHPRTRALLSAVRGQYLPNRAVVWTAGDAPADDLPLLAGKTGRDGLPTAYACRNYACAAPTSDPETLSRMILEPS